jgi:hypothetical protein
LLKGILRGRKTNAMIYRFEMHFVFDGTLESQR